MLLRRFSGNRPEEIERAALDTFHVLLQSISWGLGVECSQKLKIFRKHILSTYAFQSHPSVVLVGIVGDSDDEDFTQKGIGSEGDLRREEQRQSLNIFRIKLTLCDC